jgi:hypothetical protein
MSSSPRRDVSKSKSTLIRAPIVPERVRRIDGSFAFIPHRFLRDGFFASLAPDELRLYVALLLAGDRNGVSFYHYDTLCSLLEIPVERYLFARNALIDKDLVAYDGTRFQVLSLPERPVWVNRLPLKTAEDMERDPATIRTLLTNALAEPEVADE